MEHLWLVVFQSEGENVGRAIISDLIGSLFTTQQKEVATECDSIKKLTTSLICFTGNSYF